MNTPHRHDAPKGPGHDDHGGSSDHGHGHDHGMSTLPDPGGMPTGGLISNSATARMFAPVRNRLIAGAILAFISGLAASVPFIAVAEIARELMSSGGSDRGFVWRLVYLALGGAALRLFLFLIAAEISHFADADLQRNIRARIIRHVGVLPLGWFVTRGSAELKKAMEDDIEDMHHLVAHALNDLVAGIGMPITAVAYLIYIDWVMTAVVLSLIVVAAYFIKLSMRAYPQRIGDLMTAQRRINAATIEYVDGIQVVKAFGEDGHTYRRFSNAVDEFCRQIGAWSADIARTNSVSLLLLAPSTALLVVVISGTLLIDMGRLSAIDLLPFVLVGIGLPGPYTLIAQGVQNLRRARLAATHVEKVLDTPPLPEPSTPQLPSGNRIEFDNVSFSYDGDGDALREVNVVCEPGTVTAIVGPSGSGKTTFTRLVPRFFDVNSGAIRVGGVDVREVRSPDLLSRIAMVFQEVILLRDTVRENIRLGRPSAGDAEVEAAAQAAHIHDVITALPNGYDTVMGEGSGFLSGGERQRLTIARAILQDAPIVILDEATAFADPENEASVQEALSKLTESRTLLVIAHRLHTITHADQILVFDRGRIVEQGTHESLLAIGGLYSRLWAAQERAHVTSADIPEVTR